MQANTNSKLKNQRSRRQKLYCYVDETGQDTKSGKILPSVIASPLVSLRGTPKQSQPVNERLPRSLRSLAMTEQQSISNTLIDGYFATDSCAEKAIEVR